MPATIQEIMQQSASILRGYTHFFGRLCRGRIHVAAVQALIEGMENGQVSPQVLLMTLNSIRGEGEAEDDFFQFDSQVRQFIRQHLLNTNLIPYTLQHIPENYSELLQAADFLNEEEKAEFLSINELDLTNGLYLAARYHPSQVPMLMAYFNGLRDVYRARVLSSNFFSLYEGHAFQSFGSSEETIRIIRMQLVEALMQLPSSKRSSIFLSLTDFIYQTSFPHRREEMPHLVVRFIELLDTLELQDKIQVLTHVSENEQTILSQVIDTCPDALEPLLQIIEQPQSEVKDQLLSHRTSADQSLLNINPMPLPSLLEALKSCSLTTARYQIYFDALLYWLDTPRLVLLIQHITSFFSSKDQLRILTNDGSDSLLMRRELAYQSESSYFAIYDMVSMLDEEDQISLFEIINGKGDNVVTFAVKKSSGLNYLLPAIKKLNNNPLEVALISHRNTREKNAFILASRKNRNFAMELLLDFLNSSPLSLKEKGNILGWSDRNGYTALIKSFKWRDNLNGMLLLDTIEKLPVNDRARILGQVDKRNKNALHYAIYHGHYEILALRRLVELISQLEEEQRLTILEHSYRDGENAFKLILSLHFKQKTHHQELVLFLLKLLPKESVLKVLLHKERDLSPIFNLGKNDYLAPILLGFNEQKPVSSSSFFQSSLPVDKVRELHDFFEIITGASGWKLTEQPDHSLKATIRLEKKAVILVMQALYENDFMNIRSRQDVLNSEYVYLICPSLDFKGLSDMMENYLNNCNPECEKIKYFPGMVPGSSI